jgi:aspartyl protease family protein
VKSQELTVDQTLAYINKQLNDPLNKVKDIKIHTFVPEETVNTSNVSRIFMDDYNYQVKIEHGFLTILRTFSKRYTKVFNTAGNLYETDIYTPIIEELSISLNEIEYIPDRTPFDEFCCNGKPAILYVPVALKTSNAITKISKEFNSDGKEMNRKTEKPKYIIIQFSNDNLICGKLRNAFVHLLTLTKDNAKYNVIDIQAEKDPFETLVIKDTSNNNNLKTINTNSIPMVKKGGVYEIPVIINGSLKLNFIFDAGASDVSISPDVALTLIRTGTVTNADFLGTETYKFADGSTAKSKVFLLKEIQLGNKKVKNIKASISNSINAPLLLGQSVLNKFGKVTIDYNKSVIVFQD